MLSNFSRIGLYLTTNRAMDIRALLIGVFYCVEDKELKNKHEFLLIFGFAKKPIIGQSKDISIVLSQFLLNI